MKNTITLILLILMQLLICQNSNNLNSEPEILFNITDETFPDSWKTKEINPKAELLDSTEINRSIRIVKFAFTKYSEDILSKNLTKVYVFKSIEFFNQKFGGTNSTDAVYITNNGIIKGYTDTIVEKIFHHEFSSILLRNFPKNINIKLWSKNNLICYGDGGVNALINNTDGTEFDEILCRQGFLYQYATSDFENDFNSFAENLFCGDKTFWQLVKKYEPLQNKLKLIIDFYNKIDNKYTIEYFEELSN
jgi:hypothetical protein